MNGLSQRRGVIVLAAALAVLAAVTVLRVPLSTILLLGMVLLCPLLMVGMHGGHGRHGEHGSSDEHTGHADRERDPGTTGR